ncbi:ABC transporter ATP-binding protein [Haloechinothrix sp. LS1_15]|nr:ABC transporter ATP-binding protein [Haloechinothrix sp. LS1_15]
MVDGGTATGTQLVAGVDFRLRPGERLGLIGPSGAGKSLTALALSGLLPRGCAASGSVRLDGTELLGLPERALRRVRGRDLAQVFQDTTTALNPLTRVGRQLAEPFRRHRGMTARAAARAAVDMLDLVGLPQPAATARSAPAQLSGGQRQRVCLAMALACLPRFLVLDEPTSALDVTVQAEILDLLERLLEQEGSFPPGMLFITHDLTVVSRMCERVLVMDAGRIVEDTPARMPAHSAVAES